MACESARMIRIAALSAPSSGSKAASGEPASRNSGLADTISSETNVDSVTKVIFIYNRCDVCCLYVWSAAYHAACTVQYNIGGGAHRFGRHLNGEAHNTAHLQRVGELEE